MAYLPNHRRIARSLNGLGGVESCGSNQVWDPNITFQGIKGQCMPRSSYTADKLVDPNAYPGVVKSASSGPSTASQILGALIGGLATPKPAAAPAYVAPAASSGISTTTAIIGLGALAAVVIIATR